jgi:hypothetical protein
MADMTLQENILERTNPADKRTAMSASSIVSWFAREKRGEEESRR